MHKEELIHLHMLLAQMKKYFEDRKVGDGFPKYQSLSINPVHVHRSKAEHKKAIFILGTEIASILSKDEYSNVGKTSLRMQKLADNVSADPN